jgi:peptidoglycan hydrolase-like protein with peptidoglycan-binding domain
MVKMRKEILEEINRIHFLTYGTKNKLKVLKEQSDEQEEVKQEILNNLEEYMNNGVLTPDIIKSIQSSLIALGYPLPRYGVDGKIGSETMGALQKFQKDQGILAENAENLRSTLNQLGYDEKGSELTSGGELNSDIANIASEIFKAIKNTPKLSSIDIKTTSGHDAWHKRNRPNSKHNLGLAIDFTIQPNSSDFRSEINKILSNFKRKYSNKNFKFIDEYASPSAGATGGHFHIQIGGKPSADTTGNKNSFTISQSLVKNIHDLLIKSKNKLFFPGRIYKDTYLDLNTAEGFDKYKNICDSFITSRGANPLRITGQMLADAAKKAFNETNRYVAPELALAQLVQEGGIGNSNTSARPIRTRNPFNVGNTETGSKNFGTVQSAIDRYYSLIANDYLDEETDSDDLIDMFVNKDNKRYAADTNYEANLKQIADSIKNKYY